MNTLLKILIIVGIIFGLIFAASVLFKPSYDVVKEGIPQSVAGKDLYFDTSMISVPTGIAPAGSGYGVKNAIVNSFAQSGYKNFTVIPVTQKFTITDHFSVQYAPSVGIDQTYFDYVVLTDSTGENYLLNTSTLGSRNDSYFNGLHFLGMDGGKVYVGENLEAVK